MRQAQSTAAVAAKPANDGTRNGASECSGEKPKTKGDARLAEARTRLPPAKSPCAWLHSCGAKAAVPSARPATKPSPAAPVLAQSAEEGEPPVHERPRPAREAEKAPSPAQPPRTAVPAPAPGATPSGVPTPPPPGVVPRPSPEATPIPLPKPTAPQPTPEAAPMPLPKSGEPR